MKKCYTCGEEKSLTAFYKNKTNLDGLQRSCVTCERKRLRKRHLLETYGLSLEEYQAKEDSQQGLCAICGEENKNGDRLSVDHSHSTREVRGLLCQNCNVGLGHFGDTPERLLAAAAYLRQYASTGADASLASF